MYRKGIDVSDNQGTINWQQVKEAGVEFAILRTVRRSGKADYEFSANVAGTRIAGIPVDVYKYTYAATIDQATLEAQQVVRLLQEHGITDCTVWWDLEDASVRKLGKKMITALTKAARTIIEASGYGFGIYCNLDWYNNVLEAGAFTCPFWVARYPNSRVMTLSARPDERYRPAVDGELFGWQYSSRGNIPGIRGNVDLNEIYQEEDAWDGIPEMENPFEEPSYTLYRGRLCMKAGYVKWLQWELVRLGYLESYDEDGNDNIDGLFGRDTEDAFLRFQRKHPETYTTGYPDKKCGPRSRQTLKSL